MTAKVASPKSSPRRGLGMQRSIKSQALAALHRGPIVLHSQSIANPHKARASRCLCLFHAAGFLLLCSSAAPPNLGVCSSVGDFGSQIRLCQASAFIFSLLLLHRHATAAAVFRGRVQFIYSPNPSCQTALGCRSRHFRAPV